MLQNRKSSFIFIFLQKGQNFSGEWYDLTQRTLSVAPLEKKKRRKTQALAKLFAESRQLFSQKSSIVDIRLDSTTDFTLRKGWY